MVSKQWIGRQLPDASVPGRRSTSSSITGPISTHHSDHDACSDALSITADNAAIAGPSTIAGPSGPGGLDKRLLLHELGAVSNRPHQYPERRL